MEPFNLYIEFFTHQRSSDGMLTNRRDIRCSYVKNSKTIEQYGVGLVDPDFDAYSWHENIDNGEYFINQIGLCSLALRDIDAAFTFEFADEDGDHSMYGENQPKIK